MKQQIKYGTVDHTAQIYIPDPASADGSGMVGLVAANLTVSYTRAENDNDVVNTNVTSSLNNLAALTTAHTDWGLKEVSATLSPGLYRLDIADAVFAIGALSAVVSVAITSSLASVTPIEFILGNPLAILTEQLTAGSNTTGALPATAVSGTDYYAGNKIEAVAGTGKGQSRVVTSQAALVLTWDPLATAFDSTTIIEMTPLGIEGANDYATSDNITDLTTALNSVQAVLAAAIAAVQASLPIRLTKNTAHDNFHFELRQSADPKLPAIGMTVTAQRAIDNGAFANCTNTATIVEVSGGWYRIDLSTADTNGDNIAFKFTATGAVQTGFTAITQTAP